jgi:hypothetical protein
MQNTKKLNIQLVLLEKSFPMLHCFGFNLTPITHSCLLSSTAEFDYIETKPKETEKRLKNQIKSKIQAICYGFKTWSLMYCINIVKFY